MPRPRNPVPSYRLHKQSGQAVVTLRLTDGTRRDVLLGPFGSPESKAEYERVLAELRVAPAGARAADSPGGDPSVNEVLAAFWRHAERHYRRPDGTPTSEIKEYRQSFRPVKELYGHAPAREFGPLALKAVRGKMIDLGWCRRLVNARVGRVKRAFKWAASEELVPVAVYQALATVAGLQRGRSEAREMEPVGPVPSAAVEATLPHLTPTVRAMVELQRLTGMRPGEVCSLRPRDIDRTAAVWVYRPPAHKMSYRGRPKAVALGPRARAVLEPLLAACQPEEHVFSPARSRAERFAAMRQQRKSKVPPSQTNRARPAGQLKRRPRAHFGSDGYAAAVANAAGRAGVPHWHPNQLRHAFATEVRKRFGLEAAQVLLGHERADVTQVYAEKNAALAAAVAAEIG